MKIVYLYKRQRCTAKVPLNLAAQTLAAFKTRGYEVLLVKGV